MDPSVNGEERTTFEEGVVASYPRLFPLALRLCRNRADAHDLVQDTVERGLRRRTLFRSGDTPERWMATILRRIFVDGCRSRTRRAALALDAVEEGRQAASPADPDEPYPWEAFTVEDVQQALLFLDPASRETFSMFTFENRAQGEIAERLSISPRTVATRVFRTRGKLREMFASGEPQRRAAR